jgi:hypothetical protein
MSQGSWEDLERQGWRRRISEKNRVSYLRPREAGRVMVVNKRRDLREGEEGLGDILWPPANKRLRQQKATEVEAEPEIGEAQEVEEEAEVRERAELPADPAEEQVEVEVGEEAEEAGEMPEIKMEHKEELMKMAAVLKEVSLKEMNDSRSDLKSKRGHSHNYFKAVEEELREEVEAVSPLNPKPEREKVVYQDKFADLWDGMTVRKVTDWLQHKMELYEGSRLVLP